MPAKLSRAQARKDLYQFDPADLVLVTDESDPLYDPRVEAPLEETFVADVLRHGVHQAVIVTRRGDDTVVVAGRRRVRAAREANRRLEAGGGSQRIRVPVTLHSGDTERQLDLIISENEQRSADSPLGRARKMQRCMRHGSSLSEVADRFGVCERTVTNHLRLLTMTGAVQAAVDDGQVAICAALQLADRSPAEQDSLLADLLREGGDRADGRRRAVSVEAARRAAYARPARRPSRATVQRLLRHPEIHRVWGPQTMAVVEWLIGGGSVPLDIAPGLDRLLDEDRTTQVCRAQQHAPCLPEGAEQTTLALTAHT